MLIQCNNLNTTSLFDPCLPFSLAYAAKSSNDSAIKSQFIYDRVLLQNEYHQVNGQNHLKINHLKIEYFNSESQRAKIKKTLKTWARTSNEYMAEYRDKKSEALGERHFRTPLPEFDKLIKVFDASASITRQASKYTKTNRNIATVVDDEGVIQAISFSTLDPHNSTALRIDFLMTAPHNLRPDTNPEKVEGAGTALIEEAIAQALKNRGMQPIILTTSNSDQVAITLQSGSESNDFYSHIYFKDYNPSGGGENKILTGNDLIDFLKNTAEELQIHNFF